MQNQGKTEPNPALLNDAFEISAEAGMVFQLADGTIQACNTRAEELLGLTSQQMQGCTSIDFPWQIVHEDGSAFPGETHPAMVALQTGQPCLDVVMGFCQPTGDLIWLKVDANPLFLANSAIPYAVVTTFEEAPPDRRADRQCPKLSGCPHSLHEERYRSLFESIDDGFCLIEMLFDQNGQPIDYRFLETNPAFEKQTGLTQAVGKTARQLIPNLEASWVETYGKVALTGEPLRFENGSEVMNRWFDVYAFRFGQSVREVAIFFKDISERKRVELALESANQKISSILESITDAFVAFDSEWRFTYVNQAAERLLQHPKADLLGQSVWEVLPADGQPDEIGYQQLNRAVDEQVSVKFEAFSPSLKIHVEVNAYPSTEGLAIYWRDISDRKRVEDDRKEAEIALQEQTKLLQVIIDSIGDGLILANPQGEFVLFNQAAQEMFGHLSNEKSCGEWSSTYGLFLPDKQTLFPDHELPLARAVRGESVTDVEVFVRQATNSEGRWISISGYPVRDASGITGGVITCRDVSERKRVEAERKQIEQALQESGERFLTMADNIAQLAWMADESGWIFWYNRRWFDYTGTTLEEMQGWGWQKVHHPEYVDRVTEKFRQHIESGEIWEDTFPLLGQDGQYGWFLSRAIPIRDAQGQVLRWFGTNTDISDRVRVEAELRQKNAILNVTNESAPTPIFVKDRQGRIIYANPATLEVMGKTAEEVIGHYDSDLYPSPEDAARVMENDRRIMESGQTEVVEESHDGVRTFLVMKAPYRNEAGEVIGLIGISNDISDRIQIERDQERILHQEQAARETAERANRIKDEFLAVLSHELRTPLNPILGWSRLLQTGKLDAKKSAAALATIERNAQLQSQLIEDLLDVSRILQGKLTLNQVPVSLATAIEAALETVRLAAEAKNIQIQTTLDPKVGQISGDAGRLQQVIWNLLSNAVKFTPEGGQVKIRLTQVDRVAQMQVIDTGKGIQADFLPYVFEHFRQEDGATTRKFGGLGLGLAIVKQLVELHGGTIQANSLGEGQGATFTVQLPCLPQSSDLTQEASDPMSADCPLSGLRILVVDDDQDSRDFIAFVLEQEGANVRTAPSAIAALQILAQDSFDLLVSDIGMPGMDGYMLIQQIRSHPEYGQMRAIALTAYAGEANERQVLQAGFQQHLAKPVDPAELVVRLQQMGY
jgi:PAS domain S-box-containing protein